MIAPRSFFWLSLSILIGCSASVPFSSRNLDAEAKLFNPPAAKANLYIARGGGLFSKGVLFQVFVDEEPVGGAAPGAYLFLTVEPGAHSVSVLSGHNQDSMTVTASAGENYFVEVKIRRGLFRSGARLVKLEEQVGKSLVNRARLAQGLGHKS